MTGGGMAMGLRDEVVERVRRHWPEYLMEAAGLGLFMVSACVFSVLLFHPGSPALRAVPDPFLRRILIGIAMGLTAVALIYSPRGKRSGAHLNPAVTLTFLRLGKVHPADAVGYAAAQFLGGAAGVALSVRLLGAALGAPGVDYAATVPGPWGIGPAFLAEGVIAFGLMAVVLRVSNAPRIARWTGLCAGLLVAVYIAIEAPVSGMSMNPARTLGSALPARAWTGLWIYFTAPLLGMLAAAEVHRRVSGRHAVLCAKLHHDNPHRCIFRCAYPPAPVPAREAAACGTQGRAP